MANQKEIEAYSVFHYQDGSTRINLHFENDEWSHFEKLDPSRAVLLLDILRNEKPVYWTEEGGIVWTGKEPVGEGERG